MGQLQFSKGSGLGRLDNSRDKISAFIGNGYTTAHIAMETPYQFNNLADAEAMGITAAADLAAHMLVHYHLSEFYRFNPGVQCWLWLEADAVAIKDMLDIANSKAVQLLKVAGGVIQRLGVFINKVTGSPTLQNGLDKDVWDAIPKAQGLSNQQLALNRPIQIYIEGREFNGATADAGSLRALTAPNVCVTIAQDLDQAALDPHWTNHAAIGTLVGIKAARPVNVDVGWVEQNNIQDTTLGVWVNPGLSSNEPISYYNDDPETGDWATLGGTVATPGKGYIMPQTYMGIDGVFFNDDHTCVVITNDFYCASNNEVWNKAYRLVYSALAPKVNSPVLVNSANGQISPAVCQNYEETAEAALQPMKNAGEISDKKCICDPAQNVLSDSEVDTNFWIEPTGTARKIGGKLTLVQALSQVA